VPGLVGPCHIFPANRKDGYGVVKIKRKTVRVHRWVWEQRHGLIPAGMLIDHQCRNRACCNIDHLRVVTPRINVLENSGSPTAIAAKQTHCVNGHAFDEANTRRARGGRICRTCHRIRAREQRAKVANIRKKSLAAVLDILNRKKAKGTAK
jgi:hypothetical protein